MENYENNPNPQEFENQQQRPAAQEQTPPVSTTFFQYAKIMKSKPL